MKSVRVRICVVVDDEGRYQSSGLKGSETETYEDKALIKFAMEYDIGINTRVYFIEADLALPTPETVQGTVEEVKL